VIHEVPRRYKKRFHSILGSQALPYSFPFVPQPRKVPAKRAQAIELADEKTLRAADRRFSKQVPQVAGQVRTAADARSPGPSQSKTSNEVVTFRKHSTRTGISRNESSPGM